MSHTSTSTSTVVNKVPVDKLMATRERLGNEPELAAFRFTARNKWVEGTASTSSIREWFGAGTDHDHVEDFRFTADHPTLGNGHGPTPQEYVLHALAACVTAGIATARRIAHGVGCVLRRLALRIHGFTELHRAFDQSLGRLGDGFRIFA